MVSGGKRGSQKSWANMKIMTSTLLWVVMKPFTMKYVNSRQASALLKYLSSISYWIHSFTKWHSVWNRQQSTINVHRLYVDPPVVIPPNCTYPWCTLVPDRDPMEALVKSWFAVHNMNSQSTIYFEPTPTDQIEARETYRHQHTHKQYWSFWTFTTSTCKVQDISVAEKKKKENFSLHKTLEMCTSECKTQLSWAADHPLLDKQDKVFLSFLIRVSLLWPHQALQGQ